MRHKMNSLNKFAVGAAALLWLALAPVSLTHAQDVAPQDDPLAGLSARDRHTVESFRERVKDYVKMREAIEIKMPKLAKDSTPEQIDAHKTEFESRVRTARAGAKRGEMFTPDITAYLRNLMRTELKASEQKELRQTVLEADNKGVPLRVNYTYPETKELVEMPPPLLLKLPQLPKQLRYRFVGRNLLLVDRENGLIVDYMLNALP